MEHKKLFIDINAHISNISCEIKVDENDVIAYIAFDNIESKDITAVKFNATGYNSFGDIVQINGKDCFFLIVQDLKIDANTHVDNLKAKMPSGDIRKIKLEESQICYVDGSISTYKGADFREFEIEEYDDDDTSTNKEMLMAIREKYGEKVQVRPKEFDCGWVCACQRFNQKDSTSCSCCGKSKSDIMQLTDSNAIDSIVSEYRINEKEREIREQQATIQKAKADRRRKVKIIVGIIIGIILAFIIGHMVIMAGRTTYASESEMRKALQGTYTYYEDGEAQRQIKIEGGQLAYIYKYTGRSNWVDIDWYPEKGILHTFEDIVVTSDGDLIVDGELYEKGGYMSSGSNYTNSYENNSSYESGYSVLKITIDSVSNNSSYTVCTGSVKNTGKKTYKYVEVKGSFKDSSGNVIDTDWTYAAGSEGLAPGESTTFRLSVPKDLDIDSCSVRLLDFE